MLNLLSAIFSDKEGLTHYHTMQHFDTLKISCGKLREMEKLLVTSNFSFSHHVFYPIWHLFFILNALLDQSKTFSFGNGCKELTKIEIADFVILQTFFNNKSNVTHLSRFVFERAETW